MPARSDVTIDWTVSPRIVTVANTSDEITLQDLYDTLRNHEQRVYNSSYDQIVRAAGKDELGGDLFVGLTVTLLNAKLAFQARKTWIDTGTVTTPDTTGVTLTDSAATFITAGVAIGALVVNQTDGSVATVLRVTSQTVLVTDGLGGGVDNQFGASDAYRIQNVTQCEVSGGNLVALDDADTSMDPILPTAGTQVIRTSSSSATITEVDVGGTFTSADRTKLETIHDNGRFMSTDRTTLNQIDANTVDTFDAADRVIIELLGEHIPMCHAYMFNRLRIDLATQKLILYEEDGTTILKQWTLLAQGGGALVIPNGVQVERAAPDP